MRYLEELAAAPRVANIVAHAVPVASISDTRNSSNSSNISYSTNLPHQVYISASENSNCSTPTHSRPSSPTLSPRGSMSRSTTCLVILVGLLSATASAALTAYMAHQTQQGGHGAGLHPHHSSFQLLASTAYTLHSVLALATHSLTSNALSCMQPLCFIAGLASVSPSIYVIVKMLNTLSSRTQASSLQPIEPPSLNNFFTDQLNHLRSSRTSLRHSLTAPFTYLFNLLHVLLLYNVLCPLASLMGLRQPSIGGAADYRRAHFVMVCPLIRPTSMPLPTRRTLTIATVFLLASLWDAISPISSSNDGPSIQQPALAAALLTIEFHPCEAGTPHRHFHLNHSDTASQHSQRRSPARACLGTSRQTKARSRDLNQHSLVIDSGASFHIHPHLDDLINVKTCSTRILGVGQSSHQCTAIGDMPIRAKASDGKERDLILRNVRYASSFTDTLISVGQLWQDSAVDAVFKDECCLVLPCGLKFPFSKGKGAGLYMWKVTPIRPKRDHISRFARDALPKSPSPPTNRQLRALSFHTRSSKSISHIASLHPDVAARYMHRRLHVGSRRMNLLPKLTADAPGNLSRAKVGSCPHCVVANATKHPHKEVRYQESTPGRLIHADIAGPFLASAVGHFKYLLVLVDDSSRFKFVFPLVDRSDAPSKIRGFIASFNAYASRTGSKVQRISTLHTDGAGEFTSGKFRDELADELVHKTESPPEIHALNGVAERAIRSLFAHIRSDLEASGAPKSFWPYAAAHACDILNRTSCPPHGRHTCYEALTGDKPRVMGIWPWGCRAFGVKPSAFRSKTNIDNPAWEGMLLGRSSAQPGAFEIWLPAHHKVVSSSDCLLYTSPSPRDS